MLVETDDSWGRSFVRGAADYAQTHGPWRLLIDPRDRQDRLRLPAGWSGDGILSRLSTPAMAKHVRAAGVPAVDTDIIMDRERWIGRVVTDDTERGRLAFEHLLNRGLRQFAWFAPPSRRYDYHRGRPFEEAVRASGFDCVSYRPGYRSGRRIDWTEQQLLVSRWFDSLTRPIGIFAADARSGRQLAEICQQIGVSVPDEVAIIVGDTDDLMCSVSTPALSSVLLAARRQGHEAAALLDRLMQGRRVPRESILIEPLGVVAQQSTDVLAIDDDDVVRAIRFIRDYATHGINVTDMLKSVSVARRSLELRFQKHLGRSPAEEIRRVRLEHGKHLLSRTDLPIAKVAVACGYANATQFGVAFRGKHGLTPLAYRQQLQRAPS